MGINGAKHVQKNYNFQDFEKKWVDLMDSVYDKYGSYENRKNYKGWEFIKL